ncbi:unnamed protein product [Allacma fusca]|uniref:Uncharacterized protein n=1 Tax=Allacma fusca TaxID=39272 RepID=A0A8J2K8C0_9HEXA|nr:unnamed protein product [Allacma fusca]
MITPSVGAVIRPSVSLSKLSHLEKQEKVETDMQLKGQLDVRERAQCDQVKIQTDVVINNRTNRKNTLYENELSYADSTIRSLEDFRVAQYQSDRTGVLNVKSLPVLSQCM